jgi:hypothetical protein
MARSGISDLALVLRRVKAKPALGAGASRALSRTLAALTRRAREGFRRKPSAVHGTTQEILPCYEFTMTCSM